MYHGEQRAGLPAASAPRLRDRDHRAPRASSITPTRSARRRASAAATCSGSPPAGASCTRRCSRCSTRERAEPARAVPDLAEPAARRQVVEPHFSMLWSEDIPRARAARRRGPRDRGHRDRRRARRRRAGRPPPPPTPGPRGPTPTSRSGPSRMAPGARWTLPPRPRRHATARSTSSAATALRVGGRAVARRAGVELRADAERRRSSNGRRRARAAAAAGPADRRAGRAVRPVRDEHARRDPAGLRRLPAHALRRPSAGQRYPGRVRPPSLILESLPLRAGKRRPP